MRLVPSVRIGLKGLSELWASDVDTLLTEIEWHQRTPKLLNLSSLLQPSNILEMDITRTADVVWVLKYLPYK